MNNLAELLERIGAQPPRSGRGKWRCPKCADRKVPSLSVDLGLEAFFCHRCQWKGGRRSLERELGIVPATRIPIEIQWRVAVRERAERFQAWWRERLDFYREALAVLNDLERLCRQVGAECLEAGEEVPEWVFGDLHFTLETRPYFEQRYDLFADPERNVENLWQQYRQDLRLAA